MIESPTCPGNRVKLHQPTDNQERPSSHDGDVTVIPRSGRDHEWMEQKSRAVIAFDAEGSLEPIVFVDLSFAAGWMEAVDIDDGEYEEIAWFDDGEVIEVGVEHVARADLRVRLTPTGRYDLPALREALARTRPDMAAADVAAVRAFAIDELAAEDAWRSLAGTVDSAVGCVGNDPADSPDVVPSEPVQDPPTVGRDGEHERLLHLT